ncbi:MAG: transposase [Dysgonamonadaceae bacterium]|jgi:DNA-directed RNA polymerase subunit RPC12/RpoP|nr:transposase [Dysgonamonadaceae bacterium]
MALRNIDIGKAKFKAFREQAGVACPECGSREHYRKPDKEMYECKHCGYRQGLKTNTAMRKSKLPSRLRFLAVHLLTPAEKSFSAAGLQRQQGHERYHPVCHLEQKLRTATGLRGGEYVLAGGIGNSLREAIIF